MTINNFGRDVKALRSKKGMGSRQLSRLVGKAETYISQLERGLIKKPDYHTAHSILKHLSFTESEIATFLSNFHQIYSPEELAFTDREAEHWEEKRAAEIKSLINEPTHKPKDHTPMSSMWMNNLINALEEKNERIKEEFSFNISKNPQIFEPVINNLYALISSSRENRDIFEFFIGLFMSDLRNLSSDRREEILKIIKDTCN